MAAAFAAMSCCVRSVGSRSRGCGYDSGGSPVSIFIRPNGRTNAGGAFSVKNKTDFRDGSGGDCVGDGDSTDKRDAPNVSSNTTVTNAVGAVDASGSSVSFSSFNAFGSLFTEPMTFLFGSNDKQCIELELTPVSGRQQGVRNASVCESGEPGYDSGEEDAMDSALSISSRRGCYSPLLRCCVPIVRLFPRNGMRTFLQEKETQLFLTVSAFDPVASCIMTTKPASLFVCHHASSRMTSVLRTEGVGGVANRGGPQIPRNRAAIDSNSCSSMATSMVIGFEHEGMPGVGCFLSWQRVLRGRMCKSTGHDSQCELGLRRGCKNFGRLAEFVLHESATLQHKASGRWLYVDKESGLLILDGFRRSVWEFLPTL
eukprot:TRINITY_DN7723_c0_g1_i1.p1 TRINITY_DN7723_c0_g1~~TRINITY_DN7723_c0_g1_i1.p1  ORF type:complete len:403 (+),score=38.21 TRINITY_DN7723_c0_g1_i1:98-1210(+)